MQCALGALSPRHALATRCLAPPTHNPRPTAHMQHNPQYRPPCGLRATGLAYRLEREQHSFGDAWVRHVMPRAMG